MKEDILKHKIENTIILCEQKQEEIRTPIESTKKGREDLLIQCLNIMSTIIEILPVLEIDVRNMEHGLKILQIELENSTEYKEKYSSIKAREKQVLLDTSDYKFQINQVKKHRNLFRAQYEYAKYNLDLMKKELL